MLLLGLLSDTHGLLRPQALAALQGVSHILHAGDVGGPALLHGLAALAPVSAVRGNVDQGAWAEALPTTAVIEAEGLLLYMLHDLSALDLDPVAAGIAAVISGHSHRPRVERRGGVLYLNPGSAGPRRFSLPVTVARLRVTGGVVDAEIIELNLGSAENQ